MKHVDKIIMDHVISLTHTNKKQKEQLRLYGVFIDSYMEENRKMVEKIGQLILQINKLKGA